MTLNNEFYNVKKQVCPQQSRPILRNNILLLDENNIVVNNTIKYEDKAVKYEDNAIKYEETGKYKKEITKIS